MSTETVATGIIASGLPTGLGNIIDVGLPGFSMNELDTSHQGTSGYRTSRPGKLALPGELTLKHNWSGSYPTPQTSGDNPISIHIPTDVSGAGTFTHIAFSGWLKSYQPASAGLDGLITADSVIKVNGAITIT